MHLHVVHLSSAIGLRAAADALKAGARISLETCPQYLWLSDEDYDNLGTVMKVYPPIRTGADRAALREALFAGQINLIASDHAPHTNTEKERTLDAAPAGAPGVQTLLLSALQLAYERGDIGRAVKWVCENPALYLNVYPRKGAVQRGADADLVLIDRQAQTAIRADMMHSRQRHSPFEGTTFDFAIRAVYSRGELVAEDGRLIGQPGRGTLVAPVRAGER
jgi:dihydroorotase-like cyclic amidohydrolase